MSTKMSTEMTTKDGTRAAKYISKIYNNRLNPCSCCSNKNINIKLTEWKNNQFSYQVVCCNCSNKSKDLLSVTEAINDWNINNSYQF